MGEFDDVLAMEPGDDWAAWDEWAAGQGAGALVELAPLVAELRLPSARVHLRGAVPADVLDTFADLADPTLEVGDEAPLVTLTLDESDDSVTIVDLERGEVGRGRDVVELIDSMAAVLTEVADRTDPMRVHLAAACLELDDPVAPDARPLGVLLVDPDRSARHALAAQVLTRRARYLSAERAILLPGSRTVFAEPMPLDLATGWTRGSALGPIRPYTSVGVVVLVEHRAGAALSIQQLATAAGCARLIERTGALAEFGSAALDTVAALAAGASFWHLVHDDVEAAAGLILGLPGPERREVVTLSRFDHPHAGGAGSDDVRSRDERRRDAVSAGRASVRMARFEAGAVVVDGTDGRVEVIDDARADELERQLRPRSTSATDPADLIGLPDTPGQQHQADTSIAPTSQLGRAEAVLERVVDLLDDADGEPVLLGELVQAHDGSVPVAPTPPERIDVLVDREIVGAVAEAMQRSGFELAPHRIGVAEGGSSVEWWAPDDAITIGLHWQLAVGPFGELVDHDDLSRRSVPFAVAGRWYRALHPEDRFVLACVQVDPNGQLTVAQLRAVVLSAPRDELLMASALEASERWGATRTVTQAIRTVDAAMPGLSAWLVARARPGAAASGAEAAPRRRRRLGQGRRKGG